MILCTLLDDKHGDISDTAATLMQRLLPTLLGVHAPAAAAAGSKRAGAQDGTARRSAALDFVLAVYHQHASTQPALCALARQLCMRSQEKADMRAAALDSTLKLVSALPSMEQLNFTTFLYRLSRTARPAHRLMAVEAAHALLLELPVPFAEEAGWKVRAHYVW